ncbi:MAG: hypothetical protein AB7G11_10550 [Phycisphaerales bacterium]
MTEAWRAAADPEDRRRILHIVEPAEAGEGALAALADAQAAGARGRVIIVGDGRDANRAREYGMEPAGCVGRQRRAGGSTGWSRDARWLGGDALVCAWGECSARAWGRLAPGGEPAVIVETDVPRAGARGAIPESSTLVAFGDAVARAWRGAGAFDVRVAPADLGGVASERARIGDDVRRAAGVSERGKLIGLLADPAERADARWFAFVLGLMFAAGIEVGGVAPVGISGARRGARFVRHHSRRWSLREWSGSLKEMCRVCDAVIAPACCETGGGAEPRASAGAAMLLSAARSGAALVAVDCAVTRELSRAHPIIVARSGEGPEFGARLLDAFTSPVRGPGTRGGTGNGFGATVRAILEEAALGAGSR